MTSSEFETTTCAKWILTGEHAVLRGHPALVFPHREMQLALSFRPGTAPLRIRSTGVDADWLTRAATAVLDTLSGWFGDAIRESGGELLLHNTIPLGAGLGGSAALCVAFARWVQHRAVAGSRDIPEIAKRLEHVFHGRSSGLDIAGVGALQGLWFCKGETRPVPLAWSPCWSLTPSGVKGPTSDCIASVQQLRDEQPAWAESLDQKMAGSTQSALLALSASGPDAVELLAHAIHEAGACFESWGLVNDALKAHMAGLRARGALAVKPTGSGKGGYVLALWPPDDPASAKAQASAGATTF